MSCSPDPRQSTPLSGRKSTYPPVRISPAGSVIAPVLAKFDSFDDVVNHTDRLRHWVIGRLQRSGPFLRQLTDEERWVARICCRNSLNELGRMEVVAKIIADRSSAARPLMNADGVLVSGLLTTETALAAKDRLGDARLQIPAIQAVLPEMAGATVYSSEVENIGGAVGNFDTWLSETLRVVAPMGQRLSEWDDLLRRLSQWTDPLKIPFDGSALQRNIGIREQYLPALTFVFSEDALAKARDLLEIDRDIIEAVLCCDNGGTEHRKQTSSGPDHYDTVRREELLDLKQAVHAKHTYIADRCAERARLVDGWSRQ